MLKHLGASILLLFVLENIFLAKGFRENFDYNYEDAQKWPEMYPSCRGKRQSPININLWSLNIPTRRIPSFIFKNYDLLPTQMTIENTGHSVRLTGQWKGSKRPLISGGSLNGQYEFLEMQFHWGVADLCGSEHSINGHRYPLEIQLIHFKKSYKNVKEALKYKDGFVIYSNFVNIIKCENHVNPGLRGIVSYLAQIPKPNSTVTVTPIGLSSFVSSNRPLLGYSYVTYDGSFTSPPCCETVKWILNLQFVNATSREIESFRKLNLLNYDKFNWRPTRPACNRQVDFFVT